MTSSQSYTHVVGTRTFVVVEHISDTVMVNGISTGPGSAWRTVQDSRTGEVVREFKPPPGCYGPNPYDFTEGQRWLEQRYGQPMHGFAAVPPIPKVGEVDSLGWRCVELRNDGIGNSPPITTWERRDEARMGTRVQTRQAGTVLREDFRDERQSLHIQNWSSNSGIYVNAGSSITINGAKLFAADTKQHDLVATAAGTDTQSEDDMAQRQDFTFPYTGTEIAASLERKAAALDAQVVERVSIDRDTAALLGYSSDSDYEELVKGKQTALERKNKGLQDQASALRKEAAPYAKAGKQSFDLDLEDVGHYGLNDIDAPVQVRKVRKPREKKADTPPVVASAGGAAG